MIRSWHIAKHFDPALYQTAELVLRQPSAIQVLSCPLKRGQVQRGRIAEVVGAVSARTLRVVLLIGSRTLPLDLPRAAPLFAP